MSKNRAPKRGHPSLVLVPESVSQDTIDHLEELLETARAGELIGVAYAAMSKRRKYIVNAAGEAHRNPTFTRWMVATLDDVLSRRVLGKES